MQVLLGIITVKRHTVLATQIITIGNCQSQVGNFFDQIYL